jgi:hypothetical protein
MGESDDEMVAYMRTAWPRVKTLFENLHMMVLKSRNVSRRVATQVEDELNTLDLKVVRINTQVGNRPVGGGTAPLFEQVQALSDDLDRLSDLVSEDSSKDEVQRLMQEATATMTGAMQQNMKPMVDLFNVFSTCPTAPGDRFKAFGKDVHKAVVDIKQHAKNLEDGIKQCFLDVAEVKQDLSAVLANLGTGRQAVAPAPVQPAANPFDFWGNGVGNTPQPPVGLNVPVAAAPDQSSNFNFTQLEARIRDLEEQLESTRVVMSGVSFSSMTNTGALITTFAPTVAGRALLCFCPVGLLVVATPEMTSINEIVTYEAKSLKVGASSALEATLCASFRQELPQFFGVLSKSVARDDRVLPAMTTYELWDSQSAASGGRYMMASSVSTTVDGLVQSLSTNVAGAGLEVARTMLNDSRDFLNRLSSWITQSYQDLVNKGGSEKEAWAYVSHCVRAIFALLYKARAPGRGPFLDESRRQAGMVWGALQCHSICRHLLDSNFSGHPTLSHILNLHLRDNAVMKSSLDALVKRIDRMDGDVKGAKKAAEKAQSTTSWQKNGKGKDKDKD